MAYFIYKLQLFTEMEVAIVVDIYRVLLRSEVNSTRYLEFEKPIRPRKNPIHCFNIY